MLAVLAQLKMQHCMQENIRFAPGVEMGMVTEKICETILEI